MIDQNHISDSAVRNRTLKLSFGWIALIFFLLAILVFVLPPSVVGQTWNQLFSMILGVAWKEILFLGLLVLGIACGMMALSIHNEENGRGIKTFKWQIVGLVLILALILFLYIIFGGLAGLS